jgi:hypothetical protein
MGAMSIIKENRGRSKRFERSFVMAFFAVISIDAFVF